MWRKNSESGKALYAMSCAERGCHEHTARRTRSRSRDVCGSSRYSGGQGANALPEVPRLLRRAHRRSEGARDVHETSRHSRALSEVRLTFDRPEGPRNVCESSRDPRDRGTHEVPKMHRSVRRLLW